MSETFGVGKSWLEPQRMRRSEDRLTLSSVPLFTFGHRVSFSWLVMVDIHLVGRIVSGKVHKHFLDRPMYAIFVPALARKGSVFGGFVPLLLWFYFLHLIDFRILEYFF